MRVTGPLPTPAILSRMTGAAHARAIDPVAKVVRVEALTNDHLHDALGRIRLRGEKLFLVFAVLRARFVLLASAHGHVAVACRAVVRAGVTARVCQPSPSFPYRATMSQRGSGGSSAPRFVFSARAALIMRSAAGTSNLVVGTLLMTYGPGGDGGVPAARPERGGGGGTSRTVGGASTIARPEEEEAAVLPLAPAEATRPFPPGDSPMKSAAGPRMGGGGGDVHQNRSGGGRLEDQSRPRLVHLLPRARVERADGAAQCLLLVDRRRRLIRVRLEVGNLRIEAPVRGGVVARRESRPRVVVNRS